jgi:hypothetical protein
MPSVQDSTESRFTGLMVTSFTSFCQQQPIVAPTGTVARQRRTQFLREIVRAIAEVMPFSRVGLRLSPFADYNKVRDPDPIETYGHLTRWLDGAGLAFLHLADTNA